ncbi:hydroxymethylpyrimidine/phosphomethylpyrimidine kinase [Isoptericola sp. S6320L]|uniref:hydroxymethylpyrimidine/phosphomethylpyrimidine kinase n=1 Tax=Isoptericola sp. S6320L TaxID=2926411 RepID=UPI001FF54324|nr:hydroxymethylpyrimidine/phosphomethylpyrimidine kinase [Isoptericola sp. S6320L]MCK0117312.1 hydroxymethylpyrimidine/phosphomethylpyrimidine kinase [Isoptericola sp. S6320L]
MPSTPPLAYVIAGSEATGGAGIQADLKTFQQLGTYGVGTLTCIVSFDPENDWGHRFVPVEPQVIADQFEAATATHDLDVVKIGMLGTPATIDVVARSLASRPWRHVVLDPVLICKGQEPGAALDTDTALRAQVLPLATVVTPNLFEAKTLAGMDSVETVDDLVEAARRIHGRLGTTEGAGDGTRYVAAKGGVELPGPDAVDVLYDGEHVTVLRTPKVGEERVSGAGCTFAAAITAELAKGTDVPTAVRTAKDVVTQGIRARVAAHTPFDTVWQGAYAPQGA